MGNGLSSFGFYIDAVAAALTRQYETESVQKGFEIAKSDAAFPTYDSLICAQQSGSLDHRRTSFE